MATPTLRKKEPNPEVELSERSLHQITIFFLCTFGRLFCTVLTKETQSTMGCNLIALSVQHYTSPALTVEIVCAAGSLATAVVGIEIGLGPGLKRG